MPREHMIVESKRCKKCRWSTPYTNWSPVGEPKIPDTWFCIDERVNSVDTHCLGYMEPESDDEEQS